MTRINSQIKQLEGAQNMLEEQKGMLENSQMMKDPRAQKAAQMYQNHDTSGLKQMAENLCKEYGTTPDQMINQLKSMF